MRYILTGYISCPSKKSLLMHTSSPQWAWIKLEKWNKGAKTVVKIPLFRKTAKIKLNGTVYVRELSEPANWTTEWSSSAQVQGAPEQVAWGFRDDACLRGQETQYPGRRELAMHGPSSDKSPTTQGREGSKVQTSQKRKLKQRHWGSFSAVRPSVMLVCPQESAIL